MDSIDDGKAYFSSRKKKYLILRSQSFTNFPICYLYIKRLYTGVAYIVPDDIKLDVNVFCVL